MYSCLKRALLAVGILFMVNILGIFALAECGHTQAKTSTCTQYASLTCDGPQNVNCTMRLKTLKQYDNDFSSEGCGECDTEATVSVNQADCALLIGCVLFGGQCVQAAGNGNKQQSQILTDSPC